MKKAVLLVSLIVVLIAASLAGVVFHTASAAGPTLSATAMPGMNVAVAGRFWSPMSAVSLYLDTVDPAQLLATATPAFPMGTFNVTLSLPAISKAPHKIIGVQGGNTVNSNNFTPLTTTPVDDRLWALLQGTTAEVDNIEGKLDGTVNSLLNDGTNGLEAIKTVAGELWDQVTHADYGLQAIKTLENTINTTVNNINTEVTNIEGKLDGTVPSFISDIKTTTNLIWMEVSDGAYGLAEIKTEVSDVQTKVTDVQTKVNGPNGLAAIKNDTNNIWNAVNSPAFGLSAIKTLETTIDTKVTTTNTTVNNINAEVMSGDHGLYAIVNAVPYGLKDIKTEVSDIQTKINSGAYGLQEIKSEIQTMQGDINGMQMTMMSMLDVLNQMWSYIQAHLPPEGP